MMENGDIESVSSSEVEISPLEYCFNVKMEDPVQGDLLVTWRVLTIQTKKDGD